MQIGITWDPHKTFSVSKFWAVSIGCINVNSSTEVDLPVCGLQQTVIQKSLSINIAFKEKMALEVTWQRRYRQRTLENPCLTVKVLLHKSGLTQNVR